MSTGSTVRGHSILLSRIKEVKNKILKTLAARCATIQRPTDASNWLQHRTLPSAFTGERVGRFIGSARQQSGRGSGETVGPNRRRRGPPAVLLRSVRVQARYGSAVRELVSEPFA